MLARLGAPPALCHLPSPFYCYFHYFNVKYKVYQDILQLYIKIKRKITHLCTHYCAPSNPFYHVYFTSLHF